MGHSSSSLTANNHIWISSTWLLESRELLCQIGWLAVIVCANRVIDGFETLDDLEKVPVHEKTFRPLTDIYVRRVTIHANPLAD